LWRCFCVGMGKINCMPAGIPHILVVDDNEAILESVAMVLRWNALRVSTAASGETYHAVLQSDLPALILLDKSLGWDDGCNLCLQIKSDITTGFIKIIMFSAAKQVKEHCLSAGADAFLEKPFDIDHLLQLVRQHTTSVLLPT